MAGARQTLDEDSDRIPDTILAACVLHNICTIRGEYWDVSDDSDDSDSENDENPTQGETQHSKQLLITLPIYSSKYKHRINS